MPVSPTPSSAVSRPDLAGSLTQFDTAMDRNGFIATQVLPIFEAPNASGKFGKISVASLLANRDTVRTPGGGYSRGNFNFTEDSYITAENGAEEVVDENSAANYRTQFDAYQVATERAYDAVLRSQEIRTAALIFNSTTWTGSSLTTAISTAWTTGASAVPITDVLNAGQKVYDGTGYWPNAIILTRKAIRALKNCAQITDRIASAGAGSAIKAADITNQMLAQCFDLQYVIVAGSAKNTANEGQTAATFVSIWDATQAMVCRIATTNDIQEPCLGRTFHWSADGSQPGGTVEEYRDERVRGDVIRVRHQTHEKVLYSAMGHRLTNATA